MGEVVPKGETIAEHIGVGVKFTRGCGLVELRGDTGALCIAGVGWVQGAVAPDQPLLDRPQRLVGGRISPAMVVHRRYAEAIATIANAVSHDHGRVSVQGVSRRPRPSVRLSTSRTSAAVTVWGANRVRTREWIQ